ncbi:MAG: sigma-70 family RNA polymerase sigma factor [Kiritimatiellaeota bacterium]|nr:sigma-70 family RNA polymerase sigma factor [Kiritimatiellota bacterium]
MSKHPDQISDAELVTKFRNGDASAFDQLVNRHSTRAYQIAYGVLGNREDAEEVAQDVFVRVYRALPKFRGDAEFTTWMYRIALNLARNKYRWNKCRGIQKNISIDAPIEGRDDSESTFDLPDTEEPPDELLWNREFEQNVLEEIQKLPPIYREALVLRNVEELSYEQIAKLLGCKLGTIKSRIARAREELRQRLKV